MSSRSFRVALAAVWLGSSGALAMAPATDCAELRRIVAAAREEEPFASLRWQPHSPALGFDNCSVLDLSLEGDSPNFGCITDFPDSLRRWQRLNAEILRCLPGARRVTPRSRSPRQPGRWAGFRVGRLLILTHEAGYANRTERYVAIHIERAEED
jgi:hypothetical protein